MRQSLGTLFIMTASFLYEYACILGSWTSMDIYIQHLCIIINISLCVKACTVYKYSALHEMCFPHDI
jgi:hypothetical protein